MRKLLCCTKLAQVIKHYNHTSSMLQSETTLSYTTVLIGCKIKKHYSLVHSHPSSFIVFAVTCIEDSLALIYFTSSGVECIFFAVRDMCIMSVVM